MNNAHGLEDAIQMERVNTLTRNISQLLSEETIKRCAVIPLNLKSAKRFSAISTEQLHFLFEIKAISFNMYLVIDGAVAVEFIKSGEYSTELLLRLMDAMNKSPNRLKIMLLKSDVSKFFALLRSVRAQKIRRLIEVVPDIDKRILNMYTNLSEASQRLVVGGITSEVISAIKASTSHMVANLMDSELAVYSLSKVISCDPTLYDHSAAVAILAGAIGHACLEAPMSPRELTVVAECGLCHDIGKSCVPPGILNKPGRLTADEFEVMKSHTTAGEEELSRLISLGAGLDPLSAVVAGEHHERWSGCGYPHGKNGAKEDNEESGIHLYSRIVAIADVYSALLMKRVYKEAYAPKEALKIMIDSARADYDPALFKKFIGMATSSLNIEKQQAKTSKGRIFLII